MDKVYEQARECFKKKEDFVLATIIKRSGSAPRGVGAKMLIKRDGSCVGTIGGGSMEYQVTQDAINLLQQCSGNESQDIVHEYMLGNQEASTLGMVCGGKIEVELRYIDGSSEETRDKIEEEYTVYNKGIKKVYVFGGGHVAQATVPLLAMVGFSCIVIDDREEFADAALFPQANKVCCLDYSKLEENLTVTKEDYVVIMTRGHEHDYEVQSFALKQQAAYIGVMGSRHKIAYVTERLLKDGFSLEEIQRCHMPIGLSIGAETPEEIGVSIVAQLIQVRAQNLKE